MAASNRLASLERAGHLLFTGALLLACKREPPPPPWTGIVEDLEPRTSGRVRSLAGGSDHACALYNDGTVACWGRGAEVALGRPIPANTAARVEGVTGARRLAVGACNACALDGEGHVTCWGFSGFDCEESRSGHAAALLLPRPKRLEGIPRMRMIAAETLGDSVTAIGEDGAVWTFGSDCSSFTDSSGGGCRSARFYTFRHSHDGSPYDGWERAVATDAVDLAPSQMPCSRDTNGRARCYSGNITGGDGRPFDALSAPDGTVTRMSASYRETCFVLATGGVECRSTEGIVVPTLPGPARTVASTGLHGCATGHDGSLTCWRSPTSATGATSPAPVFTPEPTLHEPAAGVRMVVALGFDMCTLANDDTVTCGLPEGPKRRITLP